MLRGQYESVLGSLRVTSKFLGFTVYGNMAGKKKKNTKKMNATLISKHMFFIIWSKNPLFRLSKHISSIPALSLKHDENEAVENHCITCNKHVHGNEHGDLERHFYTNLSKSLLPPNWLISACSTWTGHLISCKYIFFIPSIKNEASLFAEAS